MRRNDREITDTKQIDEIMERCVCCRLGFYDAGQVYILPLNFGYARVNGDTVLYFHGAKEGKKIDLIHATQSVGFEMDTAYELCVGETACTCSAKFQSIIGTGNISFVEDTAEKAEALQAIMRHNTSKSDWQFSSDMVEAVCVFKVVVSALSCKFHA
ncbi:MAG: pyridoxamine 5'-phosphate oxidase family protein [Gemmiger sp.]|nr:pyridoxamine 5'-phosphate oxidase family protein [Gemmiger sp.]